MTVLVIALGSARDVHPNVGLAQALQRRGHRVVLVTSTVFAPLARRAGIEMHGLGTEQEFYDALRDPDLWNPYRAFSVVARRLILPMTREVYRIIEAWSGSGDTIVAAPGTAFGARIAQEKLGVPLATVHLQPSMLRSVYESPVYEFPDILGQLPRPLKRLYLRAVDHHFIDPLLASARAPVGGRRFAASKTLQGRHRSAAPAAAHRVRCHPRELPPAGAEPGFQHLAR